MLVQQLWLIGLLFLTWLLGSLADTLKGPALLGELLAGVLLGPHCAGVFMPSLAASLPVIGQLGLLLMVFEGGLMMEMQQLKQQGVRAFVLAATGTALPVLLGWGAMRMMGFGAMESVASGTALSSTAIGFTIRLMQESGLLGTGYGQLITAAAMIDDVLSLILLAILRSLQTEINPWLLLRPLLTSTMLFLGCLLFRGAITHCHSLLPTRCLSPSQHQSLLLCAMAGVGSMMMGVAELAYTTPLLGIFMAGMAFSDIEAAKPAWEETTPLAMSWLVRVFFSCSVGFVVPVAALLQPTNLATGLGLTVAAVLGKFLSGAWAAPPRSPQYSVRFVQVGAAMVGRGELGFVLATESKLAGLMTEAAFSATVVALVLATLIGPIAFRLSLRLGTGEEVESQRQQWEGGESKDEGGEIDTSKLSVEVPNTPVFRSSTQQQQQQTPVVEVVPPAGSPSRTPAVRTSAVRFEIDA